MWVRLAGVGAVQLSKLFLRTLYVYTSREVLAALSIGDMLLIECTISVVQRDSLRYALAKGSRGPPSLLRCVAPTLIYSIV